MAVLDRIDVFTQALNVAFINAYDAIAEVAPIDAALTIVPSKGRVENYPWLYPPPLMHQWQGYRQYAKLGTTNYRVPNITYSAEFEVPFEDLEDDQVDGFKKQAAALAEGAKEWRRIQTQVVLAAGQTTTCFDGTNFFASSHTIGTGNNIVTGTASGTDSVTHAMVFLIHNRSMVKPLMWQDREIEGMQTDAGSVEASKIRKVHWWSTIRGAACFGFWYDALLVKFANTPTISDMQTTLGTITARLRQFTYPKNLPSDVNQYIHGQTAFTDKNCMILCSSLIEHIVRQALTLSLVAQTENAYRGMASHLASGYLDAVV